MACTVYNEEGYAVSGQADPPGQYMKDFADSIHGYIKDDATGAVIYPKEA